MRKQLDVVDLGGLREVAGGLVHVDRIPERDGGDDEVGLALTSGRTRREIAEDLGIGLSTLTRWLSRERDAGEPVEASVDLHAELKRLRRENAVLKQERDILKKAATFFAKDASR